FLTLLPPPPPAPLFPYTTLFRSPRPRAIPDRRRALPSPDWGWKSRRRLFLLAAHLRPHRSRRFDIHFIRIGDDDAVILARTLLRSEEHTSELQSPYDLVCRLLLE